MSQRTDAINNAYDKSQNGRTSFFYVQTQVLERLGITAFKSQVNDNFIRVMPPKDPRAFWAREVYIHSEIGANRATFLCMNKMFGKPCPVCEYVEQLKAQNLNPEAIKPLYARKRYLMFVYDVRDDSTIAKGLRWYDAPGKLVSEIILKSKDKRTKAVVDVCDPVEGRDIEFIRKGQGLKTDYAGIDLKITETVPADWYENVPTFDEVLIIPTYEQVQRELTGGVAATEEQPVNDSRPPANEAPVEEQVETEVDDREVPVESEVVPLPVTDRTPTHVPTSTPAPTQTPTPSPRTGTTPHTGGPTPRGAATARTPSQQPNQTAAPSAATGDVRSKIEEIKRRRAQGQS